MQIPGRDNPNGTNFRHLLLITLMAMSVQSALAQEKFNSPEKAADKLVVAVRAGDEKGILNILGSDGKDILLSGDKVADADIKALFLTGYDLRHQVVKKDGNTAELVVGQQDWPMPIPIVRKDNGWSFDTAAGRREILYRRIGRDELRAIQASLAYVDAQHDYIDMNPENSDPPVYARKIISTEGKKDGLYWPAVANEKQSPLGPAFALATAAGYRLTGEQTPFHGYYYKILTAQGPKAPGGAANYIVNDKMIGGFALVAYPAIYGNSGVMTFVVNNDGILYQKDLGKSTGSIASDMTAFNPDEAWKKVPDSDLAVLP
ncbi:DUF2950 domain-containing protein [Nitrobacter winogradskyi]|uniref:Uncharacterized protein n=2 Tax=Nitrobacter winogradskyi TaxID=913 RepID=A0ACC6ANT7_NITWI|nr:DUF2950 domain-containing protein [Nitrobacter winogradskyi]MCP2001217.1 hypothetical protein [Nitrobacter winogradskyi]GEC17423.1 hypothetical protein NWI01_33150 [Nitrobacter winogradskyi]